MRRNRKVLVIVVTYNAEIWMDQCIDSVLKSSCIPDLFVIDNNSKDATVDYLVSIKSPRVHVFLSNENMGFGKANNIGLQYAIDNKYDYVYLLNQDAWVFHNTIEELIDLCEMNTDYGIISPFQMNRDMVHIDANFLKIIGNSDSRFRLLENLYNNTEKRAIYQVPFVMAAHWLISKDCLNKVGGFSPTFNHYGEDDNYVSRVKYFNYKIGVVPQVKAVHDRGNRKQDDLARQMYMHYVYTLNILSLPEYPASYRFIIYQWYQICKKSKNFLFTKYAIKLIKDYCRIVKNRNYSLNKCAFLQSNR